MADLDGGGSSSAPDSPESSCRNSRLIAQLEPGSCIASDIRRLQVVNDAAPRVRLPARPADVGHFLASVDILREKLGLGERVPFQGRYWRIRSQRPGTEQQDPNDLFRYLCVRLYLLFVTIVLICGEALFGTSLS